MRDLFLVLTGLSCLTLWPIFMSRGVARWQLPCRAKRARGPDNVWQGLSTSEQKAQCASAAQAHEFIQFTVVAVQCAGDSRSARAARLEANA